MIIVVCLIWLCLWVYVIVWMGVVMGYIGVWVVWWVLGIWVCWVGSGDGWIYRYIVVRFDFVRLMVLFILLGYRWIILLLCYIFVVGICVWVWILNVFWEWFWLCGGRVDVVFGGGCCCWICRGWVVFWFYWILSSSCSRWLICGWVFRIVVVEVVRIGWR